MQTIHRRKIGVIMPAITETLDATYLEGIYRQVSTCGYDTLVFTCSANMHQAMPADYVLAEESIYQLAGRADVDGIIFAMGKFRDADVRNRILNSLKDICCPCICTYFENDFFPSISIPQVDTVRMMTEHLIQIHGCTDIFCLTGQAGNPEAEERLAGWRSAMEHAGLSASQYRYGDFWVNSPRILADDIASGRVPRPQAVVCANDFMAISLCKQLAVHGIRVPEDIAVTGFDGGPNATLTDPSLTTVEGKEFDVGSNAAITLLNILDKKKRPPFRTMHLSFGRSCGCCDKSPKEYFEKIYEKYILTSEYRDVRIMSDYINRMASAESFEQLSERIDELSFIVPYWNDLYVCLRYDLTDMASVSEPKKLPDRMQLFVSRHREQLSDGNVFFQTAEILPPVVCGEGAKLMVAVPLHNSDMVFGYIVTTYSDPKKYVFDDLYVSWRDSIANALSVQYIKEQNRLLNQRLEKLSEFDRMTGMLNLKGISQKISAGQEYAFILLEIQWVQTPDNTVSITPELFVANALQMSCSETEFCFRYNKDIFGVLLSLPENLNPERFCEEWILRFDTFIDLVRQRDRKLEKPVIRIYYDIFQAQNGKIRKTLEQLIDMHLHQNHPISAVKGGLAQQLEEIRRQIIRHPSEEWTQERIAQTMQISISYFRRLYKQHFGVPFHTDLIHLRMSCAMKLLCQTDMNIKVIAEQCGYPNMYHFMTAFKKETGLTATEYRNTKRK
ncbi:MAG: substrate-binding domain-containing protein [Oscillospiraceae bacterium]|nr:substrate-binding domain-containing protein [Oscillospiraceae bacterium]